MTGLKPKRFNDTANTYPEISKRVIGDVAGAVIGGTIGVISGVILGGSEATLPTKEKDVALPKSTVLSIWP